MSHVLSAQVSSTYSISFDNAVHHEAFVTATFENLKEGDVEFIMSRSSPGRYALHEFIKNVYKVKVTDSQGHALEVSRPDSYSWTVTGHDGTIKVSYVVYGNMGDGTYLQIDETHAHLNMPATFIYMPSLEHQGIEVTFNKREDLNWKVATQLKHINGDTYYAKDFQYFMDSPTELSNYSIRSFDVKGQTINFMLHHNGSEAELDAYFEKVKKVVLQEESVFGELPKYDYGTYSFLACYMPNVSGDGMEHRNSTIVTSTTSLANGGMDSNIGTVAHEFFHCWNVERIRPKALEPFKFDQTNMSGELWFAEGFTSYFDDLSLCRAGLISIEEYIEGLSGTFNYVWNSPGRQFFNPIEMSYQAPFVDAARAVDPVNRANTFISYYSYGSALGLALDLSLREKGLNLDDFMKLMWKNFGKLEKPYTVEDLHNTLNTYSGTDFGDNFFQNYIYKSDMPDYKILLASVGVELKQDTESPYFGEAVSINNAFNGEIQRNTIIGSPAYVAGLDKGDIITAINQQPFPNGLRFDDFIEQYKVGDELAIDFLRFGESKSTKVVLAPDPSYSIGLIEKSGEKPTDKVLKNRSDWLKRE
tara:strand:- start:2923 stop:4686 length:1764 start_codon:yes stop_codon:yes gene_type:complete